MSGEEREACGFSLLCWSWGMKSMDDSCTAQPQGGPYRIVSLEFCTILVLRKRDSLSNVEAGVSSTELLDVGG